MNKEKLQELTSLGRELTITTDELVELKKKINKLEEKKQKIKSKVHIEKVVQLKKELEKIVQGINFYKNEITNIRRNYCQKNDHNYIQYSNWIGGAYFEVCDCCGESNHKNQIIELNYILSEECYTSQEYSSIGLSIQEIIKKLVELEKDYQTVNILIEQVCIYFGHVFDNCGVCSVCNCIKGYYVQYGRNYGLQRDKKNNIALGLPEKMDITEELILSKLQISKEHTVNKKRVINARYNKLKKYDAW